MPWKASDALRHTKKADTPAKQKTWAEIANKERQRCMDEDGDADECDARAIRVANAAVAKIKEGDMPYKAYTMSTNNVLIPVNAIDVDGEAVPVAELVAAYQGQQTDSGDLQEVVTKTVDGKKRPKGDFLIAEDPEKPSTWHLPVKVNGKLNRRLCGGAWAALFDPKGYRGNKYTGPKATEAKAKLKAIYKAQGWETPAAESADGFTEAVAGSLEDYAMSVKDAFRVAFKPVTVSANVEVGSELWPRDVFRDNVELGNVVVVRDNGQLYAVEYKETDEGFEFATRENWRRVVLTYVPVKEEVVEVGEVQLSESASGHAIGLAETQAAAGGPRAPLLMDVALIQPGWGNKKDNHYYSREVLARDARVFEGAKMYATDHRPGEKSVKTEVSVVKQIAGFTDDGAPIAKVAVHDPDFAEATRNRAKLGTLGSLECSILAVGRTKKGKAPDGEKGNIVEAITAATSVDWVTKAGAGGHAIALAESNTGGDDMSEEEQVITQEQEQEEESQEATLTEDGGEEEITYLAESEVKAALEASRLPPQAQGRLSESRYLDADALKAAIEQERTYIKEITGSGKPFAQGGGTAPGEEQMSEADYETAYADILRRHGLHVPQRQEAN